MGQIKDKSEDTQQGDIYALYYQQRIPGNPVWVGEKVGQTETKSVEELDGNVIFGEESLKTGGKGGGKVFHGGTPFVRNSGAAFMETTLYYYKVGKIARGWLWTMLKKLTKGGLEKLFISCSQFVY